MKNIPLLIGTIVGTLALIAVIAVVFSRTTPTPSATQTQTVDPAAVAGDRRLVTGAQNPQVTIVEFSDFQCPACKNAEPLVKSVLAQYPDQVQLIYRHFPLDSIHPNARLAAFASEAAHDEGKFWQMHDLLFERQETWASSTNQDQLKETFANYAAELQIDKTRFLDRMNDQALQARVQADAAAGSSFAVDSTPTFFVNGQAVTAPQLLTVVQSLVNQNQAP